MTLRSLLAQTEFWAALFGALAAFLLGVLATWWSSEKQKQVSINVALLTLAQMYTLLENLRYQLFVEEPTRFRELAGFDPFSFQVRGIVGVGDDVPSVHFDQLGFLAESHDPDVVNRLMMVVRSFQSMIDLVRRHADLHATLQARLLLVDRTGEKDIPVSALAGIVGIKILIEIDDAIERLRAGLPLTRDQLFNVSRQFREAARHQFPLRRFVMFDRLLRRMNVDNPPASVRPALWRRVVRWAIEALRKPRRWPWERPPSQDSPAPGPIPPVIKRFPS